MNYSLQGIGYFGLVSLRNDPLKKNRKTEKGREPSQARRDEREAPRQTTRSNQVEERRERQRVERSGSGKDGLMRRSEGELGSGM